MDAVVECAVCDGTPARRLEHGGTLCPGCALFSALSDNLELQLLTSPDPQERGRFFTAWLEVAELCGPKHPRHQG